jgi:hypothetical protein
MRAIALAIMFFALSYRQVNGVDKIVETLILITLLAFSFCVGFGV